MWVNLDPLGTIPLGIKWRRTKNPIAIRGSRLGSRKRSNFSLRRGRDFQKLMRSLRRPYYLRSFFQGLVLRASGAYAKRDKHCENPLAALSARENGTFHVLFHSPIPLYKMLYSDKISINTWLEIATCPGFRFIIHLMLQDLG